jgi:hypothetical protein
MGTIYFVDDDVALATSIQEWRISNRFKGFGLRGAGSFRKLFEKLAKHDDDHPIVFLLDSNMPLDVEEPYYAALLRVLAKYDNDPVSLCANPHRRGVLMSALLKANYPASRVIVLTAYFRAIEEDRNNIPSLEEIASKFVDVILSKQSSGPAGIEATIDAQIAALSK